MPTVRLSFSPAPAHVRTARLVGVAVARRAGVAEELLEEIRLAIGEACSRAVALHRSNGVEDLVDVALDDGDRFTVRVVDHAGNGSGLGEAADDPELLFADQSDDPTVDLALSIRSGGDAISEEAVAARMGLALLAGLVDDLEVAIVAGGLGTEVSMSWPVQRKAPDV
jgi:anti-sigma regulatory factor (Ser/Thr protein kinase)